MAVNTIGVSSSGGSGLPLGAVSTVASGYASTGGWKYNTSTAAGTYQVAVQSTSNQLYGIETANGVYLNNITNASPVPLKLNSTEASITFGSTEPFIMNQLTTVSGSIYSFGGGNGLFIIGTNTGYLYTSPDSITWTNRTSGVEGGSGSISGNATYQNDRWIIPQVQNTTGNNACLLYSTNGTTWSILDMSGQNSTSWVQFCIYANNIWVLGSQVGSTTQSIYTATTFQTSGASWTARTAPSVKVPWSIAYGQWPYGSTSYFIIGTSNGAIWYSTNGISWSEVSVGGTPLANVTATLYNPASKTFFIGGNGNGGTTTENNGWVSRGASSSSTPNQWSQSLYGNTYIMPSNSPIGIVAYGLFFLFSINASVDSGTTYFPGQYRYAVSQDGFTWTVKQTPYYFYANVQGGVQGGQINGILGFPCGYNMYATTNKNAAAFYLNSTNLTTIN